MYGSKEKSQEKLESIYTKLCNMSQFAGHSKSTDRWMLLLRENGYVRKIKKKSLKSMTNISTIRN